MSPFIFSKTCVEYATYSSSHKVSCDQQLLYEMVQFSSKQKVKNLRLWAKIVEAEAIDADGIQGSRWALTEWISWNRKREIGCCYLQLKWSIEAGQPCDLCNYMGKFMPFIRFKQTSRGLPTENGGCFTTEISCQDTVSTKVNYSATTNRRRWTNMHRILVNCTKKHIPRSCKVLKT